MKNGQGILELKDAGGCYVGEFKDDLMHGNGCFTMPDGSERLFVLDDHNGCVRSLPLHVAPNATVVRSETACGPASPIAHVGADAQFPNGTSRAWRWVDGPQGFFVTPGARSIYILDTYNNKVKVIDVAGRKISTIAGSGAADCDYHEVVINGRPRLGSAYAGFSEEAAGTGAESVL